MRRLALSFAFLSWLSFAEWKIFERLFYGDSASAGFVVESVRGVLAGTPVSRSWQHRFVGPLLVSLFGGANVALPLLLGAVGCLLLLACANIANMQLSRASARQKEIAVRLALGAGRARIVRQLLTESLLLSVAGGVVGLLLAMGGLNLLRAMGPDSIPRLKEAAIDFQSLMRPQALLDGFALRQHFRHERLPTKSGYDTHHQHQIELVEATEDAIILILSGEPINEPIAQYGPFLMNTWEELEQAINDVNAGKFGVLED